MAYPQNTFVHTTFDAESFHGRKREVVFANTLKYQLQVLKETGRYDAFKLKWNPSYNDTPNHWPVPNHLFWDSDVAKWIEGACYFLAQRDDAEIDGAVKELVQMIQSAQVSDRSHVGGEDMTNETAIGRLSQHPLHCCRTGEEILESEGLA